MTTLLLILPESLKEIEWKRLKECSFLQRIVIKGLETKIPMECLERCYWLTNITIPLNETRVLYGNRIFNNKDHFNQSFYLSNKIKVGNTRSVTKLINK